MGILKSIEKGLDARLRGIFAGSNEEAGREAIVIYRDALEQIRARVVPGNRGERLFPFNAITITLAARDTQHRAALDALFETRQLEEDIRTTLREERAAPPADLAVTVEFLENAEPEHSNNDLRVICERTERPEPAVLPPAALKPAQLVTLTGISSAEVFALAQPVVNIGRVVEVQDPSGRPVRRNELYFPDEAHEANATVSRIHAHLRFDSKAGDWRIYDDGSSVGTGLFREGKRIDVTAHGGRGVALRTGDEICLGQARLGFEYI